MKNIKYLILSVAALFSLACNKDYSAPDISSEALPDRVSATCLDGCDASALVHHPAVKETSEKGGNIEFWSCPHCGRTYADAEGKTPTVGYVYTLPTKFLKDISPLARLDMGRAGTKGSAAASTELVIVCIDLAVSVASLALTIDALCDSVDELEDAYEELEKQEDRSAEAVRLMEELYSQMEKQIDEMLVTSAQMSENLEKLNGGLDELNGYLVELNKTLAELLSSISVLAEDVRADRILDERHLLETSLEPPLYACFKTLQIYMYRDLGELYWAETRQDSIKAFKTFIGNQAKIVNIWARSERDNVSDVMSLISSFNNLSYNYKENFPVFLEHYADNHFAWEHHGFEFRRTFLLKDRFIMNLGKSLSKMYFGLSPDIDRYYAASKDSVMTLQLAQATKLMMEDSLKMARSFATRRYCNVNGKSYEVDVHLLPFKEFCDATFPCDGTNNFYDYRPQYNSMLYDMPQESSITREDVELMERFYYGEAKTIDELYFGEGVGGPQMRRSDMSANPYIVVPYATDNPVDCQMSGWYDDSDFYYYYWFWGNFHNPFDSEFLSSTKGFLRFALMHTTDTEWESYPVCFTPIYKTEQ